MRRLVVVVLCLAALASGASMVAVAPPAGAQVPRDDPSRGLIYSGLRRGGPDSVCRGAFEIVSRRPVPQDPRRIRCTHGPDPVPVDVDPRPGQDPEVSLGAKAPMGVDIAGAGAVPGTVGCYGNGTDGYRVQLMYARQASAPDRYPQYEARFREWAARVDDVFNTSAAKTGGIRHVLYVTVAQCRPVIERITISSSAVNDFGNMVDEFDERRLNRSDRKYLVWVDTDKPTYCGIAQLYDDPDPNPTPGVNDNNGNPVYDGMLGRVDTRCWGQTHLVEAHELLHLVGGVMGAFLAVADAPPNATNNGHCIDESDRLCYADGDRSGVFRPGGAPTSMKFVCPGSHEALLDCGNNDYFSTRPAPGNWLATHWNTANSAWLATGPPAGTPGSTVAGSTWYADGTRTASGPAGTVIRAYATNALANVPYQLVTGRSTTTSAPCSLDLVAVNATVVYASDSGLIGRVTGTVNRLPGTYQICFAQIDPITGSRAVTGGGTFTVT